MGSDIRVDDGYHQSWSIPEVVIRIVAMSSMKLQETNESELLSSFVPSIAC